MTTPLSRFRRWRAQEGLSLGEVSDLTGFSVSYLSRVETEQRNPSPRAKVRMARSLCVPIRDLFDVEVAEDPDEEPCPPSKRGDLGAATALMQIALILLVILAGGRWLNIEQAAQQYEGVLTPRLLRRLVAERRIPFSHAGRRVVFREADLEAYLEAGQVEPPGPTRRRFGVVS